MNTVVIKSINRAEITQAVHTFAHRLRCDYPEIIRILWFGSWIHGHPSPGSDVDLCLIVSHTDQPPRDRASQYLPVGFPVGLDLLVYTEQEFEGLDQVSPGLKREILRGTDILPIDIPSKRLAGFCERWKIIEFALFGSVLRADFRPDSDIDVMVAFSPDARWSLLDLVRMQQELEVIFSRPVDLVERDTIRNPFRKQRIMKNYQVVYAGE